jgi:hypothetical protein
MRRLLTVVVATSMFAGTAHGQDEQPKSPDLQGSGQQEQKAEPTPEQAPTAPQPEQPPAEQQPQPEQPEQQPSAQPQPEQQPTQQQPQPETPSVAPRTDAPAEQRPSLPSDERLPREPGQGRDAQDHPGISTSERDGRLIVSTVEPRLSRTGLRRDDVIVEFDGRPITRSNDFSRRLLAVRPGARVPIIIVRGGVRRTIFYSPVAAVQPIDPDAGVPDGYIDYEDTPASNAYLGVTFNSRYPNAAVVLSVVPGSPAEQAGLQRDDVIVRLDGQRVRNARTLIRMVAQRPVGAELEIQFSRLQNARVQLGERPQADRVEASRVPYDSDAPAVQPARDGRLFDGDGRLLDRRAPTPQ